MGFTFLGLEVKWYGVMITLGIVVAFIIASWIFKKIRYKEDIPFEMLLAIVPIGIICSRLWYVTMESVPLSQIFAFRQGGLTIHGAVLGGAFGLWIYTRFIKKSSFFPLADILVIVLILAQAIGRWGNFFNQELYGGVVENPYFQFFPIAVKVYGNYHYALFFYESVLNIVGFFMLMNIFSRQTKFGTTTAAYLIYYGTVRAILEPMRVEVYIMRLGPLPISVVVSLVAIAIGIAILILNKYGKIPQNDSGFIDQDAKSTPPDIIDVKPPRQQKSMKEESKQQPVPSEKEKDQSADDKVIPIEVENLPPASKPSTTKKTTSTKSSTSKKSPSQKSSTSPKSVTSKKKTAKTSATKPASKSTKDKE